jgi:hypothetical protein
MNEWARSSGEMVMADEYRSSPRKICPDATSSSTNPTRTDLGSNLRISAHNLIVRWHLEYLDVHYQILLVPVAARSKAWACGRSICGIIGFEFRRDGCLCLWVLCIFRWRSLCWDWVLVQGSPTECGVYECDREALSMRMPWPTRGCCAIKDEL